MNNIDVLFREEDFIALNKPSGMLVHILPHQKSVTDPTVVSWLRENTPSVEGVGDDPVHRPGIVHRLDKDTSGVLLVALTPDGFSYLKNLFATKTITKTYKAIVQGHVEDDKGTINIPIGIKSGTTKHTIFSSKDAKEAVTDFVVEKRFERDGKQFTLLSVSPRTGRTHQIRVHLNNMHHPVVGDALYGGKANKQAASRLMLHAYSVKFVDKKGEDVYIEAPMPQIFVDFMG